MDPDDERTIRLTVMLSPRVRDLIAGEAGDSAIGGWIWTAITEKLERDTGYVDQVRRQAPRRANRRARTEREEAAEESER